MSRCGVHVLRARCGVGVASLSGWRARFVVRSVCLILCASLAWLQTARHEYASSRYSAFNTVTHEQVLDDARRALDEAALQMERMFSETTEGAVGASKDSESHAQLWPDTESDHHPDLAPLTPSTTWTPHTAAREAALREYTRELCVVITTVPRGGQRYFLQTLASLLHALASPTLQRVTNIYILNGARPHASHTDVVWLEEQLALLRRSDPHAWPNLHIIHSDVRRARRLETVRSRTTAPANSSAALLLSSFVASGASWYQRETMDYLEALSVCDQHHRLTELVRLRPTRTPMAATTTGSSVEWPRATINSVDSDWLYDVLVDDDRARRAVKDDLSSAWSSLDDFTPDDSSAAADAAEEEMRRPPPLALVLEDDIVITHDAMRKMYHGLRTLWDGDDVSPLPFDFEWTPPQTTEIARRHVHRTLTPTIVSSSWLSWVRSFVSRDAPRPVGLVRLYMSDFWDGWETIDAVLLLPACFIVGAMAAGVCVGLDWLVRVVKKWRRVRSGPNRSDDHNDERDNLLAIDDDDDDETHAHDSDVGEARNVEATSSRFVDVESNTGSGLLGRGRGGALWSYAPSPPPSPGRTHTNFASLRSLVRSTPLVPSSVSRRWWCVALVALSSLCGLLILVGLLAVGKQHLSLFGLVNSSHRVHGLHDVEAAAGTVGIVYPSRALPAVMSHVLDAAADSANPTHLARRAPIDVLLNEWITRTASTVRQSHLVPDVVQHAGAFSSAGFKNQGSIAELKTSPSWRP